MPPPDPLQLDFSWGGLTLTGALHLPDAGGPHPAVLMMQGSGPADRDNDDYFPPIRAAFLDVGIAAYSFDKPGVGGSTGDWRDYPLEARADQAVSALETLAGHEEVEGRKVGIWGHSQGGWVAQILASRLPRLVFAICNSGPAIGIEEQDLYGCEHSMRARGHSEAEVSVALAFIRSLHAEARRASDYATVDERLLQRARAEPWYGYLTIDNETDWAFACKLAVERYDPIVALSRIQCPYLAIYGGRDVLVPAWESARESGEALDRAGNPDATVVVFPGGDHRIQDPDSGRSVTGYHHLIADWASRRVAGSTAAGPGDSLARRPVYESTEEK